MRSGSDLGKQALRGHHLPQLGVVLLYPLGPFCEIEASLRVSLLLDLLFEASHGVVQLLGPLVQRLQVLLQLVVLLLFLVQSESKRRRLLALLAEHLSEQQVRRTSDCSFGSRC